MDTRLRPFVAAKAVRRLLNNPDDTAQVFVIFRAMRGRSAQKTFRRFATSSTGAAILHDRRSLLATLEDSATLAGLPDGSVGRAYADFMVGQNLSAELRESDLAQLAGQSVSAFSRYFRRHTGMPFVQYVNRMRINLACQLLMDDALSITDICFKVGFNNLSNFNRQVLIAKGMAPSKFRRYQQLNDASRDVSDEAAARGAGIEDAPSIVPAVQTRGHARTASAAYPTT